MGKSRADAAPKEVVYVLILKMVNVYVVKTGWVDFLAYLIIDAQDLCGAYVEVFLLLDHLLT